MKTIKWDDENSRWTISGQVGGRVETCLPQIFVENFNFVKIEICMKS